MMQNNQNNVNYCKKCGKAIKAGDRFCRACGYVLVKNKEEDSSVRNNHHHADSNTVMQHQKVETANINIQTTKDSVDSGKGISMTKIVMIAFGIAIIVVGGYYFISNKKKPAPINQGYNVHDEIKKDSINTYANNSKQLEYPAVKNQENIIWSGIVNDNDPPMNIRSGPGTSYKIVTQVPNGTRLNVYEQNGTWVRVKVNNIEGWCSANLLQRNQITEGNSSATVSSYKNYTNHRFGFSLDIPRNFISGNPSQNGDGAIFWSPNKDASITVYGSNSPSIMKRTTKDEYEEKKRNAENQGQLGYHYLGGNWFVVSWKANGSIFYVKGLCGAGSINIMSVKYPESQNKLYAPIIDHMEGSFKRGNTTVSH